MPVALLFLATAMDAPHDEDWSSDALRPRLVQAHGELCWLLDRAYPLLASLALVGNRHALDARAREALRRSVCTAQERDARRARQVAWESLRDASVDLDGFNLIVTLQSAMTGATLLAGRDGATRDLAGMRGSFRVTDETERALAWVQRAIVAVRPAAVRVWLDAPVSNSGRLRARWEAHAADGDVATEVTLVADADAAMKGCAVAVSSDARVIDEAARWSDLAGWILARECPTARIARWSDAPRDDG